MSSSVSSKWIFGQFKSLKKKFGQLKTSLGLNSWKCGYLSKQKEQIIQILWQEKTDS